MTTGTWGAVDKNTLEFADNLIRFFFSFRIYKVCVMLGTRCVTFTILTDYETRSV